MRNTETTVEPERVHALNDRPPRPAGRYVLYWMQQSQRADHNPALDEAVARANACGHPVVVAFGLTPKFPEARARHYAFMLEGLAETGRRLRARGIAFVVRLGDPPAVAAELAHDAVEVVCDRNYTRGPRAWRARLARTAEVRCTEVEGDVVVPVETASTKPEVGARTLRPKIHRLWDQFLVLRPPPAVRVPVGASPPEGEDWSRPEALRAKLGVDESIAPVAEFSGGPAAAAARLKRFVRAELAGYAVNRSEPALDGGSRLSPYLHFGQISPVEIACAAHASGAPAADVDAFLEELVVRRELAMNHAWFHPDYDRYAGLPNWARASLARHAGDPRPHLYTREQFRAAATHDPYWNAAQREMVARGFMHNTMRMYWGKKILEWSASPEEAFETMIELNNAHELDGRDANSTAGVAWCFGRHDRPWGERPIYGVIRCMMASGLDRKYDMPAYLARVEKIGT
jgi:deoxyribodipyrimidine photo-lyase